MFVAPYIIPYIVNLFRQKYVLAQCLAFMLHVSFELFFRPQVEDFQQCLPKVQSRSTRHL